MAPLSDFPEPEVRFDREKFLATVHYICALCQDVDSLGKTKLHKALYYADMLNYLEHGRPLTGVDYIKQPFGPTARYLGWALKVLSENGSLQISRRSYFGWDKFDFVANGEFQTNRLSEGERALIRGVVEFVCGFSAKEISEISHAKPWEVVGFGERIPYGAAFLLLPQKLPSKRDIEWAHREAAKAIDAGIDAVA